MRKVGRINFLELLRKYRLKFERASRKCSENVLSISGRFNVNLLILKILRQFPQIMGSDRLNFERGIKNLKKTEIFKKVFKNRKEILANLYVNKIFLKIGKSH